MPVRTRPAHGIEVGELERLLVVQAPECSYAAAKRLDDSQSESCLARPSRRS